MKTLSNPADIREIRERLESLEPSSQRRWGSMSVHNMICHLSDGFLLYMGDRPAKTQSSRLPKPLLKCLALYVLVPWPHGFKTMPEIDQQIGGTPPSEFARDKQQLLGLLERFTTTPGPFNQQGHPTFGRLTAKQWMRLAYLHADHHLRQFSA
jgi:Protein of unknown function (DUF1569)